MYFLHIKCENPVQFTCRYDNIKMLVVVPRVPGGMTRLCCARPWAGLGEGSCTCSCRRGCRARRRARRRRRWSRAGMGLRPRVEAVATEGSDGGAPGGADGVEAEQIRELEVSLDGIEDVRRKLGPIGTEGLRFLHWRRFGGGNRGPI